MSDLIGCALGRFKLVEHLGKGGVGTVYRAEDLKIPGRSVALKFLRSEITAVAERRELLRREIAALAKLSHPFITALLDAHEEGGHFFFSMEYVEGETIAAHLRGGALPLHRVVTVATQVAEALAHAHGRNVLHRDIKPGNIKISNEGFVKLMDFGLAALIAIRSDAASTTTTISEEVALRPAAVGEIAGTYSYMSPEQSLGWKVDAQSDVFSFGTLLYEMITGGRPFTGAGPHEVLRAVREQPTPAIDGGTRGIPPSLVQLIERCLAKKAANRPQGMQAVLEALRAVQATLVAPGALRTTRSIPLPPDSSPPPVDPFRVPLVGRAEERARIEARLGRASAGQGSTLLVEGEAGVGKTRLVEWCLERAGEAGLSARGNCLLRGGAPPFHPFIEAAGQLLERTGLRTTSDLDQFLDQSNCPEPLRPAISRFLGLSGEVGVTPDQVLAGASRLFTSLADARPGMLVLAIEDLHWADEATVDLFCFLAHRLAGTTLVLLGSFRPERWDTSTTPIEPPHFRLREQLASREDVEVLSLERLTSEEVGQLAGVALRGSGRVARLPEVLYRASGGNPLFALEYLRELRGEGHLIQRGEEGYELSGEFEASAIPRRVQEVLERRLDHLKDREREVLEIAAVQGDVIDPGSIAIALELTRLQLLRAVRSLHSEHHLLVPVEEGFRFDHPQIREVVLQSLGGGMRREIHLLLAEALEKSYGSVEDQAPAIAMHLADGGREREAIPHLMGAGQGAARARALADAHRYYQRALTYLLRHVPEDGSRWSLVRELVDVKHEIGDDAGAETILRRELKGPPGPPDEAARAWAQIALASTRTRLGNYTEARRLLDQVEEHLGEAPDEARRALLLERANVALREAKYSEAIRSLESAERLGDESTPAGAATQYRIGHVHFLLGDYAKAGESLSKTGELAEACGDRRRQAMVLNARGYLALVQADPSEARRLGMEGLALAERVGDRRCLAHTSNNLALALATLGQLDEAIDLHQRSLALKRELGDVQGESNSLHNLARLCRHSGRLAEGLDFARKALEIKRGTGESAQLPPALLGYGNLLAACGRVAEARRTLEEALQASEETSQEEWTGMSRNAIADLDLAEGKPAEALVRYQEVAARAEKVKTPIPHINARHGIVRTFAHLGRREDLVAAVETLVKVAAELDTPQIAMVLDEARALASWSEGRFEDAANLLTQVLESARSDQRVDIQRSILRSLIRLAQVAEIPGASEWPSERENLERTLAERFETEDERESLLNAPVNHPVWVST